MARENIADDVMRLIEEQNRQQEEEEFQEWYAALLAVPEDYKRELKEGWIADVELQPLRWMNLGLTLLQSAKVTRYAQLPNGVQGPPLGSYLPYPVFQAGAEIFLKGMWLCQDEDCRLCDASFFVESPRRDEILDKLKNTLGHDLLRIIKLLRGIPEYQSDQALSDFLRTASALVRRDYFPIFKADRGNKWAFARYPKRFYDESRKEGSADSYNSYSPAPFLGRLFREAAERVDELWGLRADLAAKPNS